MSGRIEQHDEVEPIEEVHARRFDDELVLLDLADGEYYALNAVGAVIWEGFAARKTPAEVARVLTEKYEVSYEQAVLDCLSLASELVERKLLRAVRKRA